MKNEESILDLKVENSTMGRGTFLKYTGTAVAAAALLAACKHDNNSVTNPHNGTAVQFPAGDIGILNYAYALEQLEAAFYTQLQTGSYYLGLSAGSNERILLTDIQKHEVCHRDFLKAALGSSAIIGLTPFFSNINFNDRNSVLTTAKTFEDLGVSAYNGAAYFITDPNYLLLAGKIVSVEARHASAIRDLLSPGSNSFAGDDQVTVSSGLDQSNSYSTVLTAASAYITNSIDFSLLPH